MSRVSVFRRLATHIFSQPSGLEVASTSAPVFQCAATQTSRTESVRQAIRNCRAMFGSLLHSYSTSADGLLLHPSAVEVRQRAVPNAIPIALIQCPGAWTAHISLSSVFDCVKYAAIVQS